MITQSKLKELVSYDPGSGVFTNIKARGGIKVGEQLKGSEVSGYIVFKLCKKTYKAHRLAFLYMQGRIPKYVDHINGIRDDNRWCNLREATWEQNQHNSGIRKDNKSGVKGVRWNAKSKKWMAEIKLNKKAYYLGMFDSVEAAALVINDKRKALHKEFARS